DVEGERLVARRAQRERARLGPAGQRHVERGLAARLLLVVGGHLRARRGRLHARADGAPLAGARGSACGRRAPAASAGGGRGGPPPRAPGARVAPPRPATSPPRPPAPHPPPRRTPRAAATRRAGASRWSARSAPRAPSRAARCSTARRGTGRAASSPAA